MDELQKKKFKELIEKFFAPQYVGTPYIVSGSFYDKGILYREESGGELKILNLPARNVLFNEYKNNIIIPPINSGKVKLIINISHNQKKDFFYKDNQYF